MRRSLQWAPDFQAKNVPGTETPKSVPMSLVFTDVLSKPQGWGLVSPTSASLTTTCATLDRGGTENGGVVVDSATGDEKNSQG